MSVALKLDQLYPLLLPIPLTYAWWGWEDNTMFDLLRTAITDNGSISKGVKNTKRSLILLIQGEKKNRWAHTYAEPRRQPKTKEYVQTFERNEQILMIFENS